MKNYFVYILKSQKTGRYYIGHCENIPRRLLRHNSGYVRSTKYGLPWNLMYHEIFSTRREAYRREMQIKRYKGGKAFTSLFFGV